MKNVFKHTVTYFECLNTLLHIKLYSLFHEDKRRI